MPLSPAESRLPDGTFIEIEMNVILPPDSQSDLQFDGAWLKLIARSFRQKRGLSE